LVSLGL
jgi:hypothetical protein